MEEIAKIKSGDVLPTGAKVGRYNGTVRLRCVTEPDQAQKVLLHRLGIPLPRRLRQIDEFVQTWWKLSPRTERESSADGQS